LLASLAIYIAIGNEQRERVHRVFMDRCPVQGGIVTPSFPRSLLPWVFGPREAGFSRPYGALTSGASYSAGVSGTPDLSQLPGDGIDCVLAGRSPP